MTTVLAVDIQKARARVLAIQGEPGERLLVLRCDEVTFPDAEDTEPSAEEVSAEEQSEEAPVEIAEVFSEPPVHLEMLQEFEVDATLAVSDSTQVLYSHLTFPFRDQKKIEQVAPLQVQDSLPFEIDDFVLDSVVVGKSSDGEYHVLSSISPKSEIASTLASLQALGIDPKVLTTRASALGNLALLCHPDLPGVNAYALISEEHIAFAVIREGTILFLRELLRTNGDFDNSIRSLACSLLNLERELKAETNAVYVIGTQSELSYLRRVLFRPVVPLELDGIADVAEGVQTTLATVASALGAVAPEFLPKKRGEQRKFVDFRQGVFAYRRAWTAMWNALKQEAFYISIAILLGITWFGGRLYSSSAGLSDVNDRITESIRAALPGDSAPLNGEASYLQAKLDTLEEELRGMGSLSSLSPLESLKELVSAAGPSLDVSVEAISIGYSKMTLRGSVADNLSIGTLSSALKARKDRFCDVKVDPKGKTGNNRVGFSAEIAFCE